MVEFKCPKCGSDEIEMVDDQWDGGDIVQCGYCEKCGCHIEAIWESRLVLVRELGE